MKLLSKSINVFKALLREVLTFFYAAKKVCPAKVELQNSYRVEKPDGVHEVLALPKGRIFTDCCCVVGVIKGQLLYSAFSCQFSADKRYSLIKNRHGLINRFPSYFPGTVISLLTGGGGNYNYYHWLFDVLPRLFLLQDSLGLGSEYRFLLPDTRFRFQLETMSLLGFSQERLISSIQYPHIIADQLVVTSHPKSVNAPSDRQVSKWICDRLRMSFMNKSDLKIKTILPKRIYVSRGDNTNQRVLVGEAELISQLSSRGVSSYALSLLTFGEQVELFSSAEVVIGVHGAGFANLVFAPENTLVIELASQSYCPNMFEDIAFARNHKYHRIIGDEAGPRLVDASKQNIKLRHGQIDKILSLIGDH